MIKSHLILVILSDILLYENRQWTVRISSDAFTSGRKNTMRVDNSNILCFEFLKALLDLTGTLSFKYIADRLFYEDVGYPVLASYRVNFPRNQFTQNNIPLANETTFHRND